MSLKHILLASIFFFIAQNCGKSEQKTTPKTPEIELYVFTVGDILVKDISLFNPGVDEGQSKRFTNTAYLIRHPKGDLMWDTGLPDGLNQNPDGADSQAFLMKMPITLSSQLQSIGISPEEIEYLGISHLHGDHIGNMNLFTKATLLLQAEDYAGIFEADPIPPTAAKVKDNPAKKLNGDYDVFGDGTVVIKRAVGHTNGHQALFVNLPKTGPIVLSGDVYHFQKNRENRGVPAFNADKEASLASMDSIEAFLKEKNATLWIQHDYEFNQSIPHAPQVIK